MLTVISSDLVIESKRCVWIFFHPSIQNIHTSIQSYLNLNLFSPPIYESKTIHSISSSTYPSTHPSIHLIPSACASIHPKIHSVPSFYPSIHPSGKHFNAICLFSQIKLFIHPSIHPAMSHLISLFNSFFPQFIQSHLSIDHSITQSIVTSK